MLVKVILAVVVTILLMPLALQLVDIPRDLRANYVTLQSFATTLALMLGGLWALYQFVLFRDLHPHLSVSQEVTHRPISPDQLHINVLVQLNNTSRVKVEMREVLFILQEVAPISSDEAARLRDEVFKSEEIEDIKVKRTQDIQWPVRSKRTRTWDENVCVVEPRESLEVTCEFIVPLGMETVLVYTYVYNSQYKENPQRVQGWTKSTVYDIAVT